MNPFNSSFCRATLEAVAAATLTFAFVQAQAAQTVVLAQSEIGFTSRQMGVPVEGKFRKFDAEVVFDPKKLDASKVALTIDMASASLGVAETDAELAKPDWFNVKAFPKASFQSTSIVAAGPGKYTVQGKLLIKSIVREVVVPFALEQVGDRATARGTVQINRLDFKVGEGDWKDTSLVANSVVIAFKFTLVGTNPP